MIEFNEIKNWDEIKKTYPDWWAFIDPEKTKRKDGFIDKCYIYFVCPVEEKGLYVDELRKRQVHFDCIRTTFSAPNVGVIG